MQSCPKNVHTGPLTGGASKGSSKQQQVSAGASSTAAVAKPAVALALPLEPSGAVGPPSPARGSAGMPPPPSPALATARNPPPTPPAATTFAPAEGEPDLQPPKKRRRSASTPPPAPPPPPEGEDRLKPCQESVLNARPQAPRAKKDKKRERGPVEDENVEPVCAKRKRSGSGSGPPGGLRRKRSPSESEDKSKKPAALSAPVLEEKNRKMEDKNGIPAPVTVIEEEIVAPLIIAEEKLKKPQPILEEKTKKLFTLPSLVEEKLKTVTVLSLEEKKKPPILFTKPTMVEEKGKSKKISIMTDNKKVTFANIEQKNKKHLIIEEKNAKRASILIEEKNKRTSSVVEEKSKKSPSIVEEKSIKKPLVNEEKIQKKSSSSAEDKNGKRVSTTLEEKSRKASLTEEKNNNNKKLIEDKSSTVGKTIVNDRNKKAKCAATEERVKKPGPSISEDKKKTGRKAKAQLKTKPNGIRVKKDIILKNSKGSKIETEIVIKEENDECVEVALSPKTLHPTLKWSNGWSWEGEPFKAKVFLTSDDVPEVRRCYPAMRHVEGDIIYPRDCVLLRSGTRKQQLPFVAKIAAMWENPEDGEMMFSLLWYYRPEHTEQGRLPGQPPDEIFASRHKDTNSVACIEDKCFVLTFNEYCRYRRTIRAMEQGIFRPSFSSVPELESYPRFNRQPPGQVAPDIVFFCRKVYDFRQRRILKNPQLAC